MQTDVKFQNQNYNIYSIVINQVLRDQEQLPSLPSLTLKIRTAIADPGICRKALAKLISMDPSLCAILMRIAASPIYRVQRPAQSMQDVIALLGLKEVDRVVMLHSVKSLFTLNHPQLSKLFKLSWQRMVLKASMSTFLAKSLGYKSAGQAMMAALLSEVGTLAVLSAFREVEHKPDTEMFFKLCKEYSKSLGLILLKKWNLQEEYVEVLRNLGQWHLPSEGELSLLDIENLGLYHCIRVLDSNADLPPLVELAAYQKLDLSHQHVSSNQQLTMISLHRKEILAQAQSFA
ncbi:MAG TPA: HDOD domain-containing protein [Oceanospirillales bacterium]|nr:HDOD domain-containing protein [Oceanospirillales bacterium]